MDFYTETIPKDTKSVLEKIKKMPGLGMFYLSGGTALSLLLGHRESEDLDFFTNTPFKPEIMQQDLLSFGQLDNVQVDEGTLNIFLDRVKLQFLYYPYNLLEQLIPWNGIKVSSVSDIACTKLITISMRGGKKDFIDLYFILKNTSLKSLFENLEKKYIEVKYNHPHILKSLVYFNDADGQPMPRMHKDISWDSIKSSIIKDVKAFEF